MTTTIDPFDELAAMFLTSTPGAPARSASGSGAVGTATLPPPPPPSLPLPRAPGVQPSISGSALALDLLIVGHLPVRAGLWLAPFADAVARDAGPAALIRLDCEAPTIEVLRAEMPESAVTPELGLRGALEAIAPVVDRWIVLPGPFPEHHELLAVKPARIVLLTSAGEAAVVAAYQIVKELAGAAEAGGLALPEIALAVVGAERDAAAAVIERLNRTTVSFLGVEVSLALALPRMDAGIRSARYISFAGQTAPALPELRAWLDEARSVVAARQREQRAARPFSPPRAQNRPLAPQTELLDAERLLRDAPSPRELRPPRKHMDDRSPADRAEAAPAFPSAASNGAVSQPPESFPFPPLHADRAQPASAPLDPFAVAMASSAPPFPPSPVRPSPRPTIKLMPKPSVSVEPKLSAPPREPDERGRPVPLAQHVEGLISLPVRSPGHERVEIAVDRAGRLHLLGREDAIREMRIVEHWARAHRELLAMACPQHAIDSALAPRCHLFTDQPATLSDLHGADMLLHVLAPVQVQGNTGWYTAPLNAVR